MSELDDAFAKAKGEGRAVLVGYLPAGFPSLDGAVAAFEAMAAAGVDVFEIGLPYSDPLMDGPVIQAAAQRALQNGTHTSDVIETVRRVRAATGVPTLVMTYWNPVERYGIERFAGELQVAGGCGVITPDFIPDEAEAWLIAAEAFDLDPVFLAAPSSTDARLRRVAEASRGFVYAASTMGVTGVRDSVSNRAMELVQRLRATTAMPVAVGLGVSNGRQAAEVAAYADGVIVGSAFVQCVQDGSTKEITRLARELAGALR